MTRLTLILAALLSACASAPTVAPTYSECARATAEKVEHHPDFGERVKRHDILIRACQAGERA